jgi:hypothetical protein
MDGFQTHHILHRLGDGDGFKRALRLVAAFRLAVGRAFPVFVMFMSVFVLLFLRMVMAAVFAVSVPVLLLLPVSMAMAAVGAMLVGVSKNGGKYCNAEKNIHLHFHDCFSLNSSLTIDF